MITDPFYGFANNNLSQWLNRILLFLEIIAFAVAIYLEIAFGVTGFSFPWNYLAIIFGGFLAVSILNKILYVLCKLVNSVIYGTTDRRQLDKIASKRAKKHWNAPKWSTDGREEKKSIKRFDTGAEDSKSQSDKLQEQKDLLKQYSK